MADVIDIQNDIEACKIKVRELQAETIHTITIKPSGKVEVVDKERLESLNGEIDHLKDLGFHNSEVLAKLTETLQDYPTVDSLRKKKHGLENQISKTELLYKTDLGLLIQREYDIDPEKPFENAKAKALKDKRDEAFAITKPMLATATERLAKVEAVLQEFRSSGLEAGYATKDQPRAISRDKVAAFGA